MMKPLPGKVQAIAIIWIVDGILSISWGFGLMVSAVLSVIGILCLPLAVYPLVLGILELVYGIKLLQQPNRLKNPPIFLSIMEIVDIILGDMLGLAAGIATLILLNDPEVQAYFNQSGGAPPYQPMV
jgi:hypothetical protein